MRFADRAEAGRLLADKLEEGYQDQDAVIYALPRGGVVLGAEVASRLQAPLDLVIPRKVGHPSNPEYAIGAVTENGKLWVNTYEADRLSNDRLRLAAKIAKAEAKRRRQQYLADREPISAEGKLAIIIDDGIATGLTMRAAIEEVKARRPKSTVVATAVMPPEVIEDLGPEVDEIIAVHIPSHYFESVGSYYENFDQVKDEEVIELMGRTAR